MYKQRFSFFISSILLLVSFLLSGCQLSAASLAVVEAADGNPKTNVDMADCLRFPGRLWDCKGVFGAGLAESSHKTTIDIADCLRFPGRMWECKGIFGAGLAESSHKTTVDIADCLRFPGRMWDCKEIIGDRLAGYGLETTRLQNNQ
jgi:hypothetical protein